MLLKVNDWLPHSPTVFPLDGVTVRKQIDKVCVVWMTCTVPVDAFHSFVQSATSRGEEPNACRERWPCNGLFFNFQKIYEFWITPKIWGRGKRNSDLAKVASKDPTQNAYSFLEPLLMKGQPIIWPQITLARNRRTMERESTAQCLGAIQRIFQNANLEWGHTFMSMSMPLTSEHTRDEEYLAAAQSWWL